MAAFASFAGAQGFEPAINIKGEEFNKALNAVAVSPASPVFPEKGLSGAYAARVQAIEGVLAALQKDAGRAASDIDTEDSRIYAALDTISDFAREYRGAVIGSGLGEIKAGQAGVTGSFRYLQSRPESAGKVARLAQDFSMLRDLVAGLEGTQVSLKAQLRLISAEAAKQALRIGAMGDPGANPAARRELTGVLNKIAELPGLNDEAILDAPKLFKELNAQSKRIISLLDADNYGIGILASIDLDIRNNIVRRIELLQGV